jgi:murein tetrapeptide carboxypeptidase
MTRLLPLLDWEAIGRAAVPMVGFSDFTAFNLALLAKTGRASWHGPMLGSFDNPDPYMVERFAVVFGAELDPIEWEADPHLLGKWADQTEQRATGLLWGGNLCLIESLVGTAWMPPKEMLEGGILFLEDVGEYAYRVERMLLTLLDAGILARQKAVLLGAFTNADDSIRFSGDHCLADSLAYIRRRLPASIPMVTGLPFGHIAKKATLPIGVMAELSLHAGRAALSWKEMP